MATHVDIDLVLLMRIHLGRLFLRCLHVLIEKDAGGFCVRRVFRNELVLMIYLVVRWLSSR